MTTSTYIPQLTPLIAVQATAAILAVLTGPDFLPTPFFTGEHRAFTTFD